MRPSTASPRLSLALPRLTLPQVWLALAIVLPGVASLLAPLSTVDLAYQLRAGAGVLDGGGIPRVDTWTFTVAGQPWLDQQWGGQVLLAWAWRTAGWTGLVLLRSILISAAWACLVVAIRRSGRGLDARVVAMLALGAFLVTAPALALRPQLIAILLFAGVLALLAGRRAHPRTVWAVPVLVAAWANVHGSFVLGPVLAGLAWLEDVRESRRLGSRGLALATRGVSVAPRGLALAAATGLATLATPFGPGALVYALTLSSNRELAARVTEWQPPTPADVTGLLFFASLVAVVAFLVVRWRRYGLPPWPALLALAGFAALGLIAARGVAWWPAVAAVTVAGLLRPVERPADRLIADQPVPDRPPRASRRSALNTAIVALLVVAGIPLLPLWRSADPGLGLEAPGGLLGQAPPGLTGLLRSVVRPGDHVWAPQTWGSWLELAVPDARVAVDSRIELFPADVWADYDAVAAADPGWQAILDRRGATVLVVAAGQERLLAAARGDRGWRELSGGGDEGGVFVRADRGGTSG